MQALLDFLTQCNAPASLLQDDVSLDFGWRTALSSSPQDSDEVQELTSLLNDLMYQHNPRAPGACKLSTDQVSSWLQQVYSRPDADPAQSESSKLPPAALAVTAGTSTKAVDAHSNRSTAPALQAPSSHAAGGNNSTGSSWSWNVSATEFVPSWGTASVRSQVKDTSAQHQHPTTPTADWLQLPDELHDDYITHITPRDDVETAGLDPLYLLLDLFPAYDAAQLQQLLDMHGSDVWACVEEVMLLEGSPAPSSTPPAVQLSKTSTATAQHQAQAAAQQLSALELDDSAAFPSLGNKPAVPSAQPFNSSPWGAATTGWAQIASKPGTQPGTKPVSSGRPAGSAGLPAGKAALDRSAGLQNQGGTWSKGGHVIDKVATGAVVAAQYSEARSEARDWARARNVCFQQATQAYLAGNKALAKELSARGREYADRMWAAHAGAAQQIMDSRHAVRHSGVVGGPAMIDLHGLHVQEACQLLHKHIHQSRGGRAGGSQVLHVVVGVGKHAKGPKGQPRLYTAITDMLVGEGIRYKQLQPGLLEVLI